MRVLAVVESVFFPNEFGFFIHSAIGPHRADALGPLVFAQHSGTYLPFLSQHFATILGGSATLLRVGGKTKTRQSQQAGDNEVRETAHKEQAKK
jgi:hypothetical protein